MNNSLPTNADLDWFWDGFADIVAAPGGVARARELILSLAVQGKLVPQDVFDEPATQLLQRIAAEKVRLIQAGEIRKSAPLAPISEDEIPFELPKSWQWTRLGEIASYVQRGKSPKYVDQSPFPVISQKCVRWNGVEWEHAKFIEEESLDKYGDERFLAENDLLWNSTGTGTVGRICVFSPNSEYPKVVADSHVTVVRVASINARYAWILLAGPFTQNKIEDMTSGSTNQVELNLSTVIKHPFPLPPAEEQQRIVARVDELMQLCDQLEALEADKRAARAEVLRVNLARLLDAPDAATSRARWSSLSAHWPELLDAPESVAPLRQTILGLAVRGQLVPQDEADEPASHLLKQIAAEKARLVAAKKLKKSPPLPPIDADETPFELPRGWAWARFPELGEFGRGKSKHRPRNDISLYRNGQIPLVQTGDVARANGSIKTYTNQYNEVGLAQSRLWPIGTVCITIAANIADSGILSFDACFPDSVVGFIPAECMGNERYFEYFLRTAKSNLEDFAPSTAQKNINLEILGQVIIPLPPLAEQERIVARVDELMALCDRLETELRAAQNASEALGMAAVRRLANGD